MQSPVGSSQSQQLWSEFRRVTEQSELILDDFKAFALPYVAHRARDHFAGSTSMPPAVSLLLEVSQLLKQGMHSPSREAASQDGQANHFNCGKAFARDRNIMVSSLQSLLHRVRIHASIAILRECDPSNPHSSSVSIP